MATTSDTTPITDRGPIAPTANERRALEHIATLLNQSASDSPKFITVTGEKVEISPTLLRALRAVSAMLAANRAIVLNSFGPLVSRHQAADLIGIPLDYVDRLLREGELSLMDSGPVQLLSRDDVLAFRGAYKARQREALDDLARISQEMGLYDLDDGTIKLKRVSEYAEDEDGANGHS